MKLMTVEDRIVVQTMSVELEAIRLCKGARLPEAVRAGLARRQENSVNHRSGVAYRTEYVAIAL